MAESALTRRDVISQLVRSPHGDLKEYVPVGSRAAREDREFFAHLVAWDHQKGQVRDAHCALPVLALAHAAGDDEIAENALAHLAALRPREFARALEFARDVKAPTRVCRRLVERYLRNLEQDRKAWNGTALQHRSTLRRLYALYDVAPGAAKSPSDASYEKAVIFGSMTVGGVKVKMPMPVGSPFEALRGLTNQTPEEIAGTIVKFKLPFLVVRGALGAKAKDPDVVLALISRMSSTELVTNMKWLERLGVKTVPALRAALEAKLAEAATSKKKPKATLKTTVAADALEGDEALSGKLRALQEKQIDATGGIEGNWLVLGDKSGSMAASIDAARQVAGVLARMVKGKVHLIFFDTTPTYFDATGLTYEQIREGTRRVSASGGTSIGCGVQYCLDRKIAVDGIAIVSDGGDNTVPYFDTAYQKYVAKMDVEPTVYLYQLAGDANALAQRCKTAEVDIQVFDIRVAADYYSLPNLAPTMRVSRYSLVDEVMATPLRTLDEALPRTKGMPVLAGLRAAAVRV